MDQYQIAALLDCSLWSLKTISSKIRPTKLHLFYIWSICLETLLCFPFAFRFPFSCTATSIDFLTNPSSLLFHCSESCSNQRKIRGGSINLEPEVHKDRTNSSTEELSWALHTLSSLVVTAYRSRTRFRWSLGALRNQLVQPFGHLWVVALKIFVRVSLWRTEIIIIIQSI